VATVRLEWPTDLARMTGSIEPRPHAKLLTSQPGGVSALADDRAAGAPLDGLGSLLGMIAEPHMRGLGVGAMREDPTPSKIAECGGEALRCSSRGDL
jgi:hypothetical protein